MVRKVFSNTAQATRLDGGITDTATSLVAEDGSTYPAANFVIEIEDESILVGTRTGNNFTSLTREYDGTTKVAHGDLVLIRHVVVAEDFTSRLLGIPTQVPTAGDDQKVLVYDETADEFDLATQSGGGDMYVSTYDPTTIQQDAFDLQYAHGNLDGGTFA